MSTQAHAINKRLPKGLKGKIEELEVFNALPQEESISDADKINELNVKSQRIIGEYIRTGDYAKAYLSVYPNTPHYKAYENANKLIQRHRSVFNAMLDRAGLGQAKLARKLSKLVNNPDAKVALSALKLAYERQDKGREDEEVRKSTQVVIIRDEKQGKFAVGIK